MILMTILATVYIGIKYEMEIDVIFLILLLGVANGFTIYKGYIVWNPSDKEEEH